MNYTFFSHRPLAGVSIGVKEHDGLLFLAATFTNDGTSRNGLVHEDRIDRFSRKESRNKIEERIGLFIDGKTHMSDGSPLRFAIKFESQLTAKEFMFSLRKHFKPDHYETDETFCNVLQYGGTEFRARMTVNNMWDKIILMVQETNNANIST
jgi:hypothetical protein